MTTPETYDSPNDADLLLALRDEFNYQPVEHPVLFAPTPNDSSLWTDGLPDRAKINARRQQLLDAYVTALPPVFGTHRRRYEMYYAELHRREREFYAEMYYLDDLLYAVPVLPLPAESTTTIVTYQPAQPRRRGRPPSGGRKPRDRRKRPEDEPY